MRPQVILAALVLALPLAAAPALAHADSSRSQDARAGDNMRFRAMDRNRDGVITRREWNGSDQSFRVHDWNGDGVLSGDEVRVGAPRRVYSNDDYSPNRRAVFYDWTQVGFRNLDANGDGRITTDEWQYDFESFRRADQNQDDILSRSEFLNADVDIDREDRFDYLDTNNNGRIERSEWHSSADSFRWLDRNRDGVLTRTEMVSEDKVPDDQFRSLDMNRDGAIALDEWHWSRTSFNQLDRNRDGRLSRVEYDAAGPLDEGGTTSTPLNVESTDRWTDTGIYLRTGTTVTITATGSITLSNESDSAGPAGSSRRAQNAPLPDQPAGMLIGRVGTSAPISIGASRTFRVTREGRLYLGVNDDHLADNMGSFRVTVRTQVDQ